MSFFWELRPRGLTRMWPPLASTRIGAHTYDLVLAHAYGAFALLLRRSAIASILELMHPKVGAAKVGRAQAGGAKAASLDCRPSGQAIKRAISSGRLVGAVFSRRA